MNQRFSRRIGGLLVGWALCTAVAPLAPAAAAPGQPPIPCVHAAQTKSSSSPSLDDNAAQSANDARVASIKAKHPDRRLSVYSQEKEIGEGWRYGWKGGRMTYVSFLNRQGAMLSGTAFAPDPSRCPGRRPAVLVTEGITANDVLYWWQAQSLAEAGYVVLTFDYQNQGLSEDVGHTIDGKTVPPVCAAATCTRGSDPATGFLQDAHDALDFLLSSPAKPYPHQGPLMQTDKPFDRSFPFADQVDSSLVGLTGHSEGARVASVLQGQDRRVGALVALDNLASRLKGDQGSSNSQCVDGGIGTDTTAVIPRVPALGQAAPNNTACNDPELKKFAYEQWRTAGVPAVQVTVAGAKHADWSPTPTVAPGNASVPALAAYWTVAWFDRWLLHDPAAELRVLTRRFTLFDHYTGPFRLSAPEVYDPTFVSSAATGTNNCLDLRKGCPVQLPRLSTLPDTSSDAASDGSGPPNPDGSVAAPTSADAAAALLSAAQPTAALTLPSTTLPSVAGSAAAPGAEMPSTTSSFDQTPAALTGSSVGMLPALPLAGVLFTLMVLMGFRRHERLARKLGTIPTV